MALGHKWSVWSSADLALKALLAASNCRCQTAKQGVSGGLGSNGKAQRDLTE